MFIKRIGTMFITAALLFSLSGCNLPFGSQGQSDPPASDPPSQAQTRDAQSETPTSPPETSNAPSETPTTPPQTAGDSRETEGAPVDGNTHPSIRAQDYDVPVLIGNLPRSDAVDCVWSIFDGYWTAADNLYVAFVWNEGLPCVTYGIWDAGGLGFGEFINADPMGDYEAALSITFPAVEGNEAAPARPESTATVFINMSGLDNDGKINIKIEDHGDGDWYTYAYGGATSEEAYRSIQP